MTCIASTYHGQFEGVAITKNGTEVKRGTAAFPLRNESGALVQHWDGSGTDADAIVRHIGYQAITEWEQNEDGTWSAQVKPLSEIYADA
jgi:hypothetical protein